MLLHSLLVDLIFLSVSCKSLPQFEIRGEDFTNNSYIYYDVIHEKRNALKCVTNAELSCCTDVRFGNWRDATGMMVNEGIGGGFCLYVTRGDGEISLNRRNSSDCVPESGLWRCDIPDSSGDIQSLYIYISRDTSHGNTFRSWVEAL